MSWNKRKRSVAIESSRSCDVRLSVEVHSNQGELVRDYAPALAKRDEDSGCIMCLGYSLYGVPGTYIQ